MASETMTIQRIIEVHAERSTDTVKDLKKEINDLKDALLNVDKASEDYDKGVKLLREDQKRLEEVNALTKKSVDALPTSYNALNAQLVKARKQYKDLTAEERDNYEIGGKLLKEINSLDKELKKLDADMGQYQRNVGNYQSALDGVREKMEKLRGAWLAVAAVITAGYKLLKGFFKTLGDNTQEYADFFQSETAGMKAAYQELINTMYTGKGWNQLVANIKEAYANGKKFAAMLDEIFERENSLKITEAEYAEEIENSRIAARNAMLSNEERLAAAENVLTKEKELAALRKDIAKQELEANKGILQQKTKMTDADIEYFINNYNLNREAISQAQAFLEKEAELTGKIASESQVRNYKKREEYQNELDTLREGLSAEAAGILEITKKYNLSNDEIVNNYVESYIKFQTVEADYVKANAKMTKSREQMLAEVAGEETKTVEKTTEETKKKYMSAFEYQKYIISQRLALVQKGSQEALDIEKEMRALEYDNEVERLNATIENEAERNAAIEMARQVYINDILNLEGEFYDEQQRMREADAEEERKLREKQQKEDEQARKEELAKWKQLQKAKETTVKNAFTTILSLYEAFGGERAKESQSYKAIASAEAMVQALLSANEAYASMASIPYVGPALGAVSAAAALAQGMAQVRQINSTNMTSMANPASAATSAPTAAAAQAPAVIQMVETTRSLTGVQEEVRMNNAQRVYVVYDDINQAGKKVDVQTSEATF